MALLKKTTRTLIYSGILLVVTVFTFFVSKTSKPDGGWYSLDFGPNQALADVTTDPNAGACAQGSCGCSGCSAGGACGGGGCDGTGCDGG